MITRDDLNWWLELAPTLDWIFATTYARTAPHEYVVLGRTKELTPADYVRAARVIRTFGEPAKFHDWTNVYLTSPDGWKWWGMSKEDVTQEGIINRARVEHVYGTQNAPRTASGIDSAYDAIATEWDVKHGATSEEREALAALIAELVGKRPGRVLDVGCGTGLGLDMSITTPERYVGIDPSQAMLNELALKYPYVAGLHPMRLADALDRRVLGGTRFDLVTALGGAASYLRPEEVVGLKDLSSGPVLLVHFDSGCSPPTNDLPTYAAASLEAATRLAKGRAAQHRVGAFVVTIIGDRENRPR
jgi:hypothetical protein